MSDLSRNLERRQAREVDLIALDFPPEVTARSFSPSQSPCVDCGGMRAAEWSSVGPGRGRSDPWRYRCCGCQDKLDRRRAPRVLPHLVCRIAWSPTGQVRADRAFALCPGSLGAVHLAVAQALEMALLRYDEASSTLSITAEGLDWLALVDRDLYRRVELTHRTRGRSPLEVLEALGSGSPQRQADPAPLP